MEPPAVDDPATNPIRFRPSKKRKAAYRQRSDDGNGEPTYPVQVDATAPKPRDDAIDDLKPVKKEEEDEGDEIDQLIDDATSVTAALRLRNARKARLRGVGFRSDGRADNNTASAQRALILADPSAQEKEVAVMGIADRFMHQTGLIAELNDRHMTDYIESRLSSRNAPTSPTSGDHNTSEATQQKQTANPAAPRHDQPVLQGKLMEVDIPAGLVGGGASTNQDSRQRSAKRPRLGKDGKPWRPRNRRGSDDIKRDQLVEAFLHENRLDVYDVPEPSSAVINAREEDGAADDLLAEQFQKQYMNDVAQRRQRKKPAQPPKPGNEDVLRGPKLGGSRNTRAAMRDILLKKEKESKDSKR